MTELRPLREHGTDDLGRLLLGSAELDRVPRGALERAASRLGVSAAALGVGGAAAGAASASVASGAQATASALEPSAISGLAQGGGQATVGQVSAASGAVATPGTVMGSLQAAASGIGVPGFGMATLKSLLIGVVAGVAISSGGHRVAVMLETPSPRSNAIAAPLTASGAAASGSEALRPLSSTARPAHPEGLSAPLARPAGSADAPRMGELGAEVLSSDATGLPGRDRGHSGSTHGEAAAGQPDSALAQEVAELDRAREALASGSPDAALAALDAHAQRSGNALTREAQTLRIEALRQQGKRADAALAAERMLASGASGHLASWLRKVIRESADARNPGAR